MAAPGSAVVDLTTPGGERVTVRLETDEGQLALSVTAVSPTPCPALVACGTDLLKTTFVAAAGPDGAMCVRYDVPQPVDAPQAAPEDPILVPLLGGPGGYAQHMRAAQAAGVVISAEAAMRPERLGLATAIYGAALGVDAKAIVARVPAAMHVDLPPDTLARMAALPSAYELITGDNALPGAEQLGRMLRGLRNQAALARDPDEAFALLPGRVAPSVAHEYERAFEPMRAHTIAVRALVAAGGDAADLAPPEDALIIAAVGF